MDQQARAEYRYRVVWEVIGGSLIGEVADRYGTSTQSLHAWRRRFEAEAGYPRPGGPVPTAADQSGPGAGCGGGIDLYAAHGSSGVGASPDRERAHHPAQRPRQVHPTRPAARIYGNKPPRIS